MNMSTALVSSFHNLEDVISLNRRTMGRTLAGPERMMGLGTPITGANRNNKQVPVGSQSTGAYLHSGRVVSSVPSTTSLSSAQLISTSMSPSDVSRFVSSVGEMSKHQNTGPQRSDMEAFVEVTPRRKLDRSISEPAPDKHINSSRYKTELCRPFEENGSCKYREKCQFAHGVHELRCLTRHPKYKTELCRTFHTVGFCPYGPRCHFIHNEDERKLNQMIQQQAAQQQQKVGQPQVPATAQQPVVQPVAATRKQIPQSLAINLNQVSFDRDTLGSTADSPPSSVTDSPTALSPVFGNGHGMDDLFTSISTAFTPPPASAPPAPFTGVFTFPEFPPPPMKMAHNPSLVTPLNITTEQAGALVSSLNNLHLSQAAKSTAMLNQQRNNNLNNLLNNSLFQEKRALTKANVVCPPSPPDSVDGEFCPAVIPPPAMHNIVQPEMEGIQDPKALRLPIFSRLASKDA